VREKREERGGKMEKKVREGEVRERNRSASDGNIEDYIKKRKRERREERGKRKMLLSKENAEIAYRDKGDKGRGGEGKGKEWGRKWRRRGGVGNR